MLPHTSRLLTVSTTEKLSAWVESAQGPTFLAYAVRTYKTLRAFGRLPFLIAVCSVQYIMVMSSLRRKSLRNLKIILKVVCL